MRRLNVLLAALWLAACQQEAGPTAPAAKAPAQSDGQSAAPAEPTRLDAIPAGFHGVWAATQADCAPPAESRLEITAERLNFYESTGEPSKVEATGPAEVLITVPLAGEGTRSIRTYRYRLLNDGEALFDVRSGFTRSRCPTA